MEDLYKAFLGMEEESAKALLTAWKSLSKVH
jgi:hypothetical protein